MILSVLLPDYGFLLKRCHHLQDCIKLTDLSLTSYKVIFKSWVLTLILDLIIELTYYIDYRSNLEFHQLSLLGRIHLLKT